MTNLLIEQKGFLNYKNLYAKSCLKAYGHTTLNLLFHKIIAIEKGVITLLFEFFGTIIQHLLYLALHVERNQSFPKPLSTREEKECFIKMEQGDTKARDRLIEHNLRLVAHIIKKYYASTDDQDDLISIGTIGLIKAVNTFHYSKGTRFATYASRCIENVILTQRLYSISNRETVTPRLCAGRSGNRKKTTCLSSTARSLALSPMRRSTFCGSLSIR